VCDLSYRRLLAHKKTTGVLNPPPNGVFVEITGSPKFPRDLDCPFALFFDPGRIAASDHYEASNVVPAHTTAKTPTMKKLSRLNSKAFGLVVYASQ
jgi:hypothetical protein